MERDDNISEKIMNGTIFLPKELIIEILLRLPVKSLIRFKCMCKSWISLISDPYFALSHFELTTQHTERLVVLVPRTRQFLSIDFNASLHDDFSFSALKLEFLPPKPCETQIRGSCRGFVLLDCCQSLWVWNPSTGDHKQVSRSPIASSVMFFIFLYGFGYDPSTDDYLVVQASCNIYGVIRVEIFSIRTNAWKEMEGVHLSKMNNWNDRRNGFLLDGANAIHWLTYRYHVSIHFILAFDLIERNFSEVPLPVGFEEHYNFNFCDLGVLGESLSLCVVGYHCPAEIWVMKEYKVQSSWTKTIVVSVDHIPSKYFSLVCSTKSGDIVGIAGTAGLVKCNDQGQLQELQHHCDPPNGSQVVVYTKSLLSLPFDNEQVEDD
ncbi:F-box/kelch-repeat protein At3g06240 [Cajanus cajan]|uniref:F-box/kelch-repeat protein At3g06240 family n=1 Tax=Cajanus cajan TaxID=3821 RepID=A0A151SXC2_CAJCA|nr:F-box/kelch-repeat protein At3g06240 [Cajanus cajan]KYP59434.1 F-box/kelch-repeat protein At3g06240 family [Cajanus cajan]